MAFAVAAFALVRTARADGDTDVPYGVGERPDSVGLLGGVTFDGAPSVGLAGRFALSERFALDGQLRTRGVADNELVGDLGLAWTITYGRLDTTYGDRLSYPLRLDLIAGAAIVDGEPALAVGVALRARVARYVTVELALRDELARGRPIVPPGARGDEPWIQTPLLGHAPEVQVAISLTAPHASPVN
ncbi:MAG: hypothetical protein KF773_26135 [Deltaproteobacteria bacterium]|nr:hypothetical protein [Deltaproteobacteria bacterium]MCW5802602.1 hypothetical protein [Deltaproteobacteria bacterium]